MFGIQPLFWLVYVLAPVILLAVFAWKNPKLMPLAILICPILDFIFFHQDFLYYEATGIMLIFTALQTAIVAILALMIRAKAAGKKERDNT